MFVKKTSIAAIAALGTLALCGSAAAELHSMSWMYGSDAQNAGELNLLDFSTIGEQIDQGTTNEWLMSTPFEVGNGLRIDSMDCFSTINNADGGAEALVDAEFQVTNNSASTQNFQLLMTLVVGPHGPLTDRNGSVATTVTNNQFGGDATLSAPSNGSVYRAFTDLTDPFVDPPAHTLMDDPFSVVASGPFATADDNADFGTTVGPMVNNTISIMFEFELSAGDSASVSGLFRIVAVPAPGALALLGLAGVAGRRRRRN